MTKKLNNKGFTFVELLCTIVIVLLLTACITMGIGLGSKTFDKTYKFTKAQTLASTLNYLISEELRTATDLTIDNGVLEKYRSENYGKNVAMTVGSGENEEGYNKGRIVVVRGDPDDPYDVAGNVYTFGASKLYGDNLQVKGDTFTVEITGDQKTFKVHFDIIDKRDPNTSLVKSDFQVKRWKSSDTELQ